MGILGSLDISVREGVVDIGMDWSGFGCKYVSLGKIRFGELNGIVGGFWVFLQKRV